LRPVVPPRTGVLLRGLKPGLRSRSQGFLRPITLLIGSRRIDNAGDMPGPTEHKARLARK
jgi:hypothetical protein